MLASLASLVRSSGDVDKQRSPAETDSFAKQWEYCATPTRFNLVMCGRRSGKTHGARLRALRRVLTVPGSKVLYVTLIRRNCRKLFWRPIQADLAALGWTCEANEVDMLLRLPNGSSIEATGCDDIRGAAKIRGDFYDLVIIDEAQEPNDDVLEPLVEEVFVPMLVDRGGDLDLLGTPPDAMVGYFIDRLSDARWTRFGWSMFDNRFIAREEIEKLIEAKGITPEHPIYKREFLGLAVVDPEKLVYEYTVARNNFDLERLDTSADTWRYTLGLDLGFQDSDAIAVVGWRRDDVDRRLYTVYQWRENHLDVDALAAKVREVYERYRPVVMVGDHGGHAAQKILKTISERLRTPITAKPTDVNLSIGLVNDDLRNSRLLIPAGTELVRDMGLITWSIDAETKKREANKRGYHSDLADALRYAHHGARHWAAKPPKPEMSRDERRHNSWLAEVKRQQDPWRD